MKASNQTVRICPSTLALLAQGPHAGVHDVVGSALSAAIYPGTAAALSHVMTALAKPDGPASVLVEGVGERKLTISRFDNGVAGVTLSLPPVTQLVLSGGGAKGIAFPGVIKALEDKGALKDIQVISGSSAGGISAALLASGMDAEGFDTLSDSIELPQLLNSKNPCLAWLQNACSTVGKTVGQLPGRAGSLSQLLCTLLPRLQSHAQPLEELVRSESRQAVLAHIADTPRDTRPSALMAIADRLSAGGATTFNDLEVLSRHIPAIKQLNIIGTCMVEGRPQLVVFNASLTPDMDIARAVHISGSLPYLFSQPVEQGLAFQVKAEKTRFQDGGLLLNTPVRDLFERTFAPSALSKPQQLIVDFEAQAPAASAVRGGFVSTLIDGMTGVAHTAAEERTRAKLSGYADQTVTLPLKNDKGDYRSTLDGTVNFTMTADVKNHLQERARQAVDAHLEKRGALREYHQFNSVDDVVLAMDDELFANVEPTLAKDGACSDVLRFRQGAKQALQALDSAITDANVAPTLKLTPQLGSALRNLDALARSPEQIEWLGIKLNASDNPNYQQLLQSMAARPTHSGHVPTISRVMVSALSEMKKRDIAVIADNFTREVIYPSLFRQGQPDGNVALLRRAEHNLARATTASQVNQVLDDIIGNYAARDSAWKQPRHSTTVEMAQAWRIPT